MCQTRSHEGPGTTAAKDSVPDPSRTTVLLRVPDLWKKPHPDTPRTRHRPSLVLAHNSGALLSP